MLCLTGRRVVSATERPSEDLEEGDHAEGQLRARARLHEHLGRPESGVGAAVGHRLHDGRGLQLHERVRRHAHRRLQAVAHLQLRGRPHGCPLYPGRGTAVETALRNHVVVVHLISFWAFSHAYNGFENASWSMCKQS